MSEATTNLREQFREILQGSSTPTELPSCLAPNGAADSALLVTSIPSSSVSAGFMTAAESSPPPPQAARGDAIFAPPVSPTATGSVTSEPNNWYVAILIGVVILICVGVAILCSIRTDVPVLPEPSPGSHPPVDALKRRMRAHDGDAPTRVDDPEGGIELEDDSEDDSEPSRPAVLPPEPEEASAPPPVARRPEKAARAAKVTGDEGGSDPLWQPLPDL